jgi:hypothetical protein
LSSLSRWRARAELLGRGVRARRRGLFGALLCLRARLLEGDEEQPLELRRLGDPGDRERDLLEVIIDLDLHAARLDPARLARRLPERSGERQPQPLARHVEQVPLRRALG